MKEDRDRLSAQNDRISAQDGRISALESDMKVLKSDMKENRDRISALESDWTSPGVRKKKKKMSMRKKCVDYEFCVGELCMSC